MWTRAAALQRVGDPPESSDSPVRRATRSHFAMLALILAGGIALRVFHLDHLSLWNDELFSRYYYETGLRFMWTQGLQSESSPPLYYMALGAWMQAFGATEAAMRALSVAASTGAIVLVYLLGREILNRQQALLAAALFAMSAVQIYYAQEARPYALLLLPVGLTLLCCARYLGEPGGVWNLAGYSAGAVLCIYTHATMVFFVAACGTAVLAAVASPQRVRSRGIPLGWIAANAVVALLVLPEIIGMLAHVKEDGLNWIPSPGLLTIGMTLSEIVVGPLTQVHFPGGELTVLLLGVLALAIWRHPPGGRAAMVMIAIPGLYAGAVLLVSLLVQPILLSRIFCWVGIPLCLLPAHALSVRSVLRPVVAVAVFAVIAIGLSDQLGATPDAKEPWRSVIRQIEPSLARADLVVLSPQTDPADLFYYAPKTHPVRMWSEGLPPTSEDTALRQVFGISQITRQEIIAEIDRGARLVLILRAADGDFLKALLREVPEPRRRIERKCGRYAENACITVLSWQRDIGPD